jgi:O-antigen/teichoic acid export membrane protein
MLDKIKQLSKETAIYGISTMVGRFLNFLLVPFYTHIFNRTEFGVYSNIYAFVGIFNIIFIYGMDAAFLKFASKVEVGDDKDNFSTPFLSILLTGIILSAAIALARYPILEMLEVPASYSKLIIYSAGILLIDSLNVIPFLKLRLERKAGKFAAFKLTNIIVNVIFNLVLLLVFKFGIEAIFISNLLATLSSLILLSPTIKQFLRFRLYSPLLRKLLKFGLPFFPASIAAMLIQVVDKPILAHMKDLKTVGTYNACYKLGVFMLLFVSMFQYAWQPFFLQNAEEKNAKELFSKILTLFSIVGGITVIFFTLFTDNIVEFKFFGRSLIAAAYWGGLKIVPIVLLAYLFYGLYVVFSAGIYIKEKSIYVPLVTGIGAIVNVGFNIILIPGYSIMGAAFATLASYVVLAAGFFIVTQKFYRINYEYSKVIKIFLAILIINFIYYYLLYNNYLFFVYKLILFLAFTLFIAFFVFEKKEILFLKEKILKRLSTQ